MASKCTKKGRTLKIEGILDVNEDGIFVEVEGFKNSVNLATFVSELDSTFVKIQFVENDIDVTEEYLKELEEDNEEEIEW